MAAGDYDLGGRIFGGKGSGLVDHCEIKVMKLAARLLLGEPHGSPFVVDNPDIVTQGVGQRSGAGVE
jgi:hypothetical protein